jgi:hypothetical protein
MHEALVKIFQEPTMTLPKAIFIHEDNFAFIKQVTEDLSSRADNQQKPCFSKKGTDLPVRFTEFTVLC